MTKIPIGTVGLILKCRDPKEVGWYIKVLPEDKGGHVILYSPKADFGKDVIVYDDWVLEDELDKYFEEAQLEIDWETL